MKKRIVKYGGAVTGMDEERAIIKSIRKSRKTRNWQQAEEGAMFERELSAYLRVKYAILTNSGSSAGLLALSALDLPRGSEVIISAVTFPTIFNIILQCGLTPVVVDAKVGTYGFDIADVARAITGKTRAIIAIHPLGNPVDMPKLMKVVKEINLERAIDVAKYAVNKKENNKIYVIEDNCDGWGSTIAGKQVGSFGDIGITSFHAAHIVSMGVGGGVFTNSKELAQKVRMYRDWGRQADINKSENLKHKELPKDYNPRFIYEKIGYNFQILDLQAAMGRVQLRKTHLIKAARKRNFDYLVKHIKGDKYNPLKQFIFPETINGADVCWFSFPLTYIGDRGPLLRHLEKNGIETRPMFSGNILRHPFIKNVFHKLPLNYELTKGSRLSITPYVVSGKLEGADYITKHSFWISCHPSLTKSDLKYIIKVFDGYFGK